MPRLAIVSALHDELSAVLALLPDEHKTTAAGRDFWLGHLHGHEVVVVLSRIGKVAAATTATVLIERFGVQQIVFTGVAGGLAPGVAVGDLVVAGEFLQHDMDPSPLFPRYEVPYYGMSRFPTDAALSTRLAQAARTALADPTATLGPEAVAEFHLHAPKVHSGLVISGDRFVSAGAEAHALQTALPDALCVEMEGAAIAQVCHDCGVAFAAVRTISDRADDTAHVDFLRFVRGVASHYSAAIVDALLRDAAEVS